MFGRGLPAQSPAAVQHALTPVGLLPAALSTGVGAQTQRPLALVVIAARSRWRWSTARSYRRC